MYEELPIDILVRNPNNTNRISKMFSKKLRHNIEQIGLYETITVRPHPEEKNKFEILNGHTRIDILKEIGKNTVRCDIWNVDDTNANLLIAILNKLRGSEVPELRMNLIFDLMKDFSKEELVANIPETKAYLNKLEKLQETSYQPSKEEKEITGKVIIKFYLSPENHQIIIKALDKIMNDYKLIDSETALLKLAQLYLNKEL